MINHIKGKLIEKTPAYVVIEVGGVGYLLNVSVNTFSQLKDTDTECKLYTHLSIKEDAYTLYGFATEQERMIFRQLISVSGVGPNTARLILSSLSVDNLVAAIATGNLKVIEGVKGIGKKTAQRLVMELKEKLSKNEYNVSDMAVGSTGAADRLEAVSALTILGFNRQAADAAVSKILEKEGSGLSVEDLVKRALRML